MRRISPAVLRLVLLGGVLFLSLFAAGAAVISFLLMRAGYGIAVWGVVPFLALVLVAAAFGVLVWRLTRGQQPGTSRSGVPEKKPRREGSRGGDDV